MHRLFLIALLGVSCAQSQDMSQMSMPGMRMPGIPQDPAARLLMGQASGTSMNPAVGAMPMIMKSVAGWRYMFMGQAFVIDTQQSGPRGGDKFYAPNWAMGMADHAFAGGTFEFETMLSLDPATITERRYPELFQTGETAFGKPIVDGQHPHDFIMSLGAQWARSLGENTIFQLYYAPVGDPALGPVAFPHRTSASEIPQAPLGHHWQDSTHIADNVLTAALKFRIVRLEASGFYGSEPDENRWNIDWGPMNSWSTRLSIFPSDRWMAQVSAGRLARPERQSPGDVVRSTASLHYSAPIHGATWASSFIWGRNHDLLTQRNLNSYLLESVLPVSRKNYLTGRAELVDKDELFANDADVEQELARTAGSTFRIGAYTLGYTRDVAGWEHTVLGLGFNVSAYTLPAAIKPFYGDHPIGGNVFARFRLR